MHISHENFLEIPQTDDPIGEATTLKKVHVILIAVLMLIKKFEQSQFFASPTTS